MNVKHCTSCEKQIDAGLFPRHNKSRDGYARMCLACKRSRMSGGIVDVLVCTECATEKPITEFYRSKHRVSGVRSACKSCSDRRKSVWYEQTMEERRKVEREYRKKNRARIKGYSKVYHQKNSVARAEYARRWKERRPTYWSEWGRSNRWKARLCRQKRRAYEKAAPGKFTMLDIADLLILQRGRCAYCCAELTETFQIDHIIPISKGGTNYPDNLACACRSCNRLKRDRLDWWPVLDCFKPRGVAHA